MEVRRRDARLLLLPRRRVIPGARKEIVMTKISEKQRLYWAKKYETDLSEESHREIWANLSGVYSIFMGIADRMDGGTIPTSAASGCM
jgi:hypothetical protein